MALPKIDTPTFMLDLPSTKKAIKYRPFTVKEEKILLTALQSGESREINEAIKQIISNCIVSNDVDINNLTNYDAEYIFLNLRSKSVSNVVNINVTDPDDEQQYETEIDLDKIEVQFDKEHKYEIVLNEQITLMMKDPTFEMISNIESDNLNDIIIACIDKVLVGDDEVILMKDHTKKEQSDFIDSFSSKNALDVQKFFTTVPRLKHTVSYKNSEKKTKKIEVEGLANFFT